MTRETPLGAPWPCRRTKQCWPRRALPRALALAIVCCIAACGTPQGACPRTESGLPNILLILADDLGYADLGFTGATDIATPNLDALARQGVVFANGYAAYSVCSPSRAGLMTGRYPSRFGMENNLGYAPDDAQYGLPLDETVLAAYLKRAGYRTGMVGKWHLGAAKPFHPLHRGFDSWYGFLGGGHDYFRYDATGFAVEEYLVPIGQGRGMTGFTGYLTDRLTDEAIAFAKESPDKPFFLYLAYNAPHNPLQAPAALIARRQHPMSEERRRYLAMVDSLDQNVGRLIDALRTANQWCNTLAFFLSDNGGDVRWASAGPLRGNKGSFHEGGIRVPFVASWPARWPQGETFQPMVISLDIPATALALAGVAADAERPLDGVNLDPFVRGMQPRPPHEALFWRYSRTAGPQHVRFAARSAHLKLVGNSRMGMRLYDLRDDPGESRNVRGEAEAAAQRLASLWNEWNLGNAATAPGQNEYGRRIELARARFHHQARLADQTAPAFQIGEPAKPRDIAPPGAPAGLLAVAGRSNLRLSWDAPQDRRVIRYQYRLREVGQERWLPWQEIESWWEAAQHRVPMPTRGADYLVQVRAASGGGWGPPSEAAAAR